MKFLSKILSVKNRKFDANETESFFNNAIEVLILSLFILTSLIRTSFTYNSFELPKIVWIKVLVWVLVGLTLIKILVGQEFRFKIHQLNLWILVFFAGHLVSLIKAGSISLGLERIRFLLSLLIFTFILQDYLRKDRKNLFKISAGITLSAVLTSIWVVYEDFISVFSPESVTIVSKLADWRGYLSAGFGNTSHIGDFLAIGWMIGFFWFIFVQNKRSVIFYLISLSLIFPGLIVCWSITSNFSLIIGVLILFSFIIRESYERRHLKKRIGRLIILGVICALISLFYITNHRLNPHSPGIFKQAFSSDRWKEGGPTRLAIWWTTIEIIKKNPILGVGAGNFTFAFPQTLSPLVLNDPQFMSYAGRYTNAVHNELLQTLAEEGIFGIIPLLMILIIFFKNILINFKAFYSPHIRIYWLLFILMIIFIIQSLMNYTLQLPYSSLFFYSLLSVSIYVMRKSEKEKILIPIEYQFNILKTTIYLENMDFPREIGFSTDGSKAFKFVSVFFVVILIISCVTVSFKVLWSDMWYKRAAILREIGLRSDADKYFKIALEYNPENSDCRSAYSEFLVEGKHFREAIKEIEKVRKRLRSNELYSRLARAYEGLGMEKKALENWFLFFETLPENKNIHSFQYEKLKEKKDFNILGK